MRSLPATDLVSGELMRMRDSGGLIIGQGLMPALGDYVP